MPRLWAMIMNGSRIEAEENSQWGKARLGQGYGVTVLFPQVCHGRDEPPRVPCGELVWRTLQKLHSKAPFISVPSRAGAAASQMETRGHCSSDIGAPAPRHGFVPTAFHHPFAPLASVSDKGDPGGWTLRPEVQAKGPPNLLCPAFRSYNESCSPDPTEQGGPKSCCTLDDVPLIR